MGSRRSRRKHFGSRRWLKLGLLALMFGARTVQAVEPATQPCPWPENGQEIYGPEQNDHGVSWTYHCLAHMGAAESVFFLDERVGWAATSTSAPDGSGAALLRTTDAGRTWTAGSLPPANRWLILHDVVFVDAAHGWAVGDEAPEDGDCCAAVVLRTIDGGATWTRLPQPPGTVGLDKVRFVDALHGWVLDPDGKIGHTEDGGRTWTVADLQIYTHYRDMAFVDRHTGWIIGDSKDHNSVWKTTNGGRTWTAQPVPAGFTTMAAYDHRTMRASGGVRPGSGSRSGCLYRTTDGGRSRTGFPLPNRRTCPPAE